MYGNYRWNNEFAGVLARTSLTESWRGNAFVNASGELQFYIRIISVQPDDFPKEVKEVTFFGEELERRCGFYDNKTLGDSARVEALERYLDQYVLFFNVEKVKRGTDDFYNAKNISVAKKSRSFRENIVLEAIPIFSYKLNRNLISKDIFEQNLANNRPVGENKQVSKEDDDTPSLIIWNDEDNESEYTVYGSFESHEYLSSYGFRFSSKLPLKKTKMNEDILFNSYSREDVMFIDSDNCARLQDMLDSAGKTLSVIEELSKKKEMVENKTTSNDKEFELMETFKRVCRNQGLYYDEKDLYNFHTAMKTGGLVILAGMSGTGKSKLVKCYADSLKIQEGNVLMIPVRPSWQDDADLLGYVDTINQLYRPGDSGLINLLVHASQKNDDLYIVCFDEMNLARVEHYFSQFLSVLESGGDLQLYNAEYNSLYNASVFPANIKLGANIMFVGTVNLDESTYHFSDKVLDRANVITLEMQSYAGFMKMEQNRLTDVENEQEMEGSAITATTYKAFKKNSQVVSLTEQESELLWNLHVEMQKSNKNLGIGWRIVKQINSFLSNLPANSPFTREEAFDIQIIQRVLTKLRGTEEQFGELLGTYKLDSKEVEDSILLNLLSNLPEYDFEKSIQVIHGKAKELRLYGHTI
ncbi:McrB family protein [Priestia megaterium]|uniref:McrB family protein n=1 Tax=Priestia megaterium TaxID=1404 RepID=UPI0024533241|nr:AAA family ATPase [Priestia megaterium]MDH3155923.1 AAA family ATPase [Priestia megaterium]MED4116307.1 AAA family ATPase [Priestia megaterium]